MKQSKPARARIENAFRRIVFPLLAILSATGLQAQSTKWTGTIDNDWTKAGNWDNGVPNSTTETSIANGGTAAIGSGSLLQSNTLYVGANGPSGGTLLITSGTLQAGLVVVGAGPSTGVIRLTGTGAALIVPLNNFELGGSSTGSLLIESGARVVQDEIGSNFRIGGAPASSGSASVQGNGSLLIVDDANAQIGLLGAGSVVVGDGGLAQFTGTLGLSLGAQLGSSGTITLNGTGSARGAVEAVFIAEEAGDGTIIFDGGILRARSSQSDFLQNFEAGDVTINSGGAFIDSNGFNIGISTDLTGTGQLTKIGTGTLILTGSNSYAGGTFVRSGTLSVGSGGSIRHSGTNIEVGVSAGDNAALVIGSGTVSNGLAFVASGSGSRGAVTINGGRWVSAADLVVGFSGTGSLIVNSGTVSNVVGFVGGTAEASGAVTVNGGGWVNSSDLVVAYGGSGTMTVNSGTVSNVVGFIGSLAGGSGSVTVDGGSWVNSGDLVVGDFGAGSLSLNSGAVSNQIAFIGTNAGSSGTVTVSGGTWNSAAEVYTGFDGTGTVNVTDSGVVRVASGTGLITLGFSGSSAGTLNIGTGGAAGSLLAGEVTGGVGTATVNFNHTGTVNFAPNLTGSLSVNKLASGTTVLTGSNSYTGATDVQAGTLLVNGVKSGGGAVTVRDGATLGGSGTMAGVVTIENGGILAPGNSPGTLTVGGLILSGTSQVQFELGTVSDLVVVQNNLTLDGVLNVTGGTGFGAGIYTLFTYGGTLTDNGLAFGSLPAGFFYALDFSVAGSVRLSIATTDLYWDGPNTTPDGVISGGSGTWNNSTTNWTTASGSTNFPWNSSGTAVFSGSAGTVTVAETINVADIVFETDGYVVSGTGPLAVSGSTLTVNTGSGVTAEISTSIIGTGGLVKTGTGGTLVLTGSSNFSGTTTVRSGTLAVSGTGAVVDGSIRILVGDAPGDDGTLLIADGGLVDVDLLRLSEQLGSVGTTVVSGGTLRASGIEIARAGVGTLSISEGLVSSANSVILGNDVGSEGILLVTGGTLSAGVDIVVGWTGTGRMTVDGGFVTAENVAISQGAMFGPGSLVVSSGTLIANDLLEVGAGFFGEMLIDGGFVSSSRTDVGAANGNSGSLTVSSGTLATATTFRVGSQGTGVMTLTDDGVVSIGSGTLQMGSNLFGNATLNIGSGTTAAGTLLANVITASAGTSVVNFNHTGTTVFAPRIEGAIAVNQVAGTTILTGSSSYTQGTEITGGTLQIGNGGTTGSVSGNITNDATLAFNRSDAFTFGGTISGTGVVRQIGTGTLTLGAVNTYSGGTDIVSGVLQISGSTSLGTGDVEIGTAELRATSDATVGGMSLIAVSDGATGTFSAGAGQTLTLSPLDFLLTGDATLSVGSAGNTGTVLFAPTGAVALTADAQVAVNVGTLRAGTTGLAFITDIAESTTVAAGATLEFADQTAGGGIWNLQGAGLVNTGTLATTNLQISQGDFSGTLAGSGSLEKVDAGTLVLRSANTYANGTTISGGTLETRSTAALGSGTVNLNAGSLAPVGELDITSLTWTGGTIASTIGTTGSFVDISGNLTLTGDGEFVFAGGLGFAPNTTYAILSAANLAGFGAADFSGNTLLGLAPKFTIEGDTLFVNFEGATSGPLLQNSGPVFTPTDADFRVVGRARTGGPSDNNIVNSLIFDPNGRLRVFNDLQVTSGRFTVRRGMAYLNGGRVIVPGDFNLIGRGTLQTGSAFAIGGDANINGGNLIINNAFTAGGNMNVHSTVTVNGNAQIGGSLNTDASEIVVNGVFGIGRSANIANGSSLLVNTGGVMNVAEATIIHAGSRGQINGLLASPQVNNSGLLKGTGVIAGNLWNNGVVAPGNSPGTLTVNGNYTQTRAGTLEIEPGDLLLVSGNASLAGTLRLVAAGKLRYGQQITFLQAGSISGEFDEIAVPNPSKNRGRLLVNGGTGTLLIAPASYTLVAETSNQRKVARALDAFIAAKNNDREVVSVALDLQTAEQYPAAFDQIAPTYYETLGNITIEQVFVQTQQLNQRLSAVRLGARGFQAIGIESPLVHDKDGKSVFDAKDAKKAVTPEEVANPNWNIWAMGTGQFGRLTSVSQVPNTNFNSGGFLVGADYTFGGRDRSPNGPSTAGWDNQPYLAIGIFGGYQYTWADAGSSGNTQINSALFGGYASYTQGGFYADGVVGGGYNAYRVRRGIQFSTVDRTARSQPNGGQFSAALNLGYDWQVGKFTLGPIAGVQYSYAGIAPFSETGAESLDLRVAQQNVNSLRTTFGGRVAYTWNVTENIALIPEVRMFWQHEFLNNPRNISSALDNGAGPTFGYETSAPARDSVFAGAGVSAQFGERWNAFFYWNVDFGRQDYFGNSISGGLNWKF